MKGNEQQKWASHFGIETATSAPVTLPLLARADPWPMYKIVYSVVVFENNSSRR
jgi:hypothetical protein